MNRNYEGKLKILSWNIAGLKKHKSCIENIIGTHRPSIIALQEPFIASSKKQTSTKLTGYNAIVTTRYNKSANVITYIRKGIQFTHIPNNSTHAAETFKISLKNVNASYTITNIYKPPKQELDHTALEATVTSNNNNILVGDFNLKTRETSNKLTDLIDENDLHTCNIKNMSTNFSKLQTHSESTIDHMLHDRILDSELASFEVLQGYDKISNYHRPLLATYKTQVSEPQIPVRHSRNLDQKAYKESLRNIVASGKYPLIDIQRKEDILPAAKRIENIVNDALDDCLPKKVPKPKRLEIWKPSDYVKFLFKRKEKAGKDIKASEGKPEREYFKLLRQTISDEIDLQIKTEKTDIYIKAVNKIKENPKNGRNFWKELNKLSGLKKRQDHGCIINYNGETATDSKGKAEIHLKYQQDIFTENEPANDDVKLNFEALKDDNDLFLLDDSELIPGTDFEPIDIDEIKWILSTTSGHKAAGPDDLNAIYYKWATTEILNDIVNICNACIRFKHEPKHWKEATVILIPKDGKDHSHPSGYRPISLLITIAKLFEKTMSKRLAKVIEEEVNDDGSPFLPAIQSGFRVGKSTNDHAFRLWNLMTKTSQLKKQSTALISLDLEKAFDRIPHPVILAPIIKLARKNSQHAYLAHFLAEFLRGRTFRTRIDQTISTSQGTISAGVPQGSSIGPIAFNMATADAPEPAKTYSELHPSVTATWGDSERKYFNSKSRLRGEASTFADDQSNAQPINLADGTVDYYVPLGVIKSHLLNIEEYATKNKMRYNAGKTGLLLASTKNNRNTKHTPDITFCNEKLTASRTVKHLGIDYDDNMTMNPFVTRIYNSCKSRIGKIGWLTRGSNITPTESMKIMKPLVFSLVQYGSITWLGNPRHEEKMNGIYSTARRYACQALPWERTDTLKKIIPDADLSLTDWCYKINIKWYEKNKDLGAVADSIKHTTSRGISESRIRLMGNVFKRNRNIKKLNTPNYYLTERIKLIDEQRRAKEHAADIRRDLNRR